MSHAGLQKRRDEVRRRPQDADAWWELATLAMASGARDEAVAAFGQALDLSGTDTALALQIADALAQMGETENAEHVVRRVIAREPDLMAPRLALAQFLLARGDEEGAAREVALALEETPRSPELRLLAAAIDERRGALARAADHLAIILADDLDHPEANHRLGGILMQLGDASGAVRCWRRLVARDTEDLEALSMLGISLSNDGQHVEATQILQDVAVRRGDGDAHANLGMALVLGGHEDAAISAFKTALAIDPHSAQAYCGLGLAHQKRGELKEAAEAFRRTDGLAPDNASGALNLGLALDALGDREGAKRAFLRAAAVDPDDPEIRDALEAFLSRGTQEASNTQGGGPIDASMGGDLKIFPLFDVLEFLRIQNRTGMLVLSSRHGASVIRLAGGAISSATAPGTIRLGETLVGRGLLRAQDLQQLLARQKKDAAGAGGEVTCELLCVQLLRHKLVDQKKLAEALSAQILSALGEVIEWNEGSFSFHPDEAGEPPPIAFNLQEVMLELLRVSDERQHAERSRS